MDISIVVPAYNEQNRLPASLVRIREYLARRGGESEILVVDDGSSDQTVEVAHESLVGFPHARILSNQPNRGKGYSVKRGLLESRGKIALFTDADLSTPIEEFEKLLAAHERGADIAIGSRAMAESDIQVHQPIQREVMGRLFNVFIQTFVMRGIRDTQCGFKSFRRDVIEPVIGRQTVERWGFDVEILYIATRLGLSIAEVPVIWRNDEATKVSAGTDGMRMLQEALLARRLHKHLKPADLTRAGEPPVADQAVG